MELAPEPDATPSETAPEEKRRLTPAEWAEIVTVWELGKVTLDDLNKQFGISVAAISKGLKSRGATKGSRSHEIAAEVTRATIRTSEEQAFSAAAERKRKIEETKAEAYQWARTLQQQIVGQFVKAQKDELPFEAVMGNIKTLKIAIDALEKGRQTRYAVLNADQDVDAEQLEQLVISNLTNEEIEKLKQMDEDDGLLLDMPEFDEDLVDEK